MSVVNTELSQKVKRVMLMIFAIDVIDVNRRIKCNSFLLSCFLQFACTNLDGCQKEGANFLNLLQKEGDHSKTAEGGGEEGVLTLEETMVTKITSRIGVS